MDDDTYLNAPLLVKLLQKYNHEGLHYLGKPSLKYPIETYQRPTNVSTFFLYMENPALYLHQKEYVRKFSLWSFLRSYSSSITFFCNCIKLFPKTRTVSRGQLFLLRGWQNDYCPKLNTIHKIWGIKDERVILLFQYIWLNQSVVCLLTQDHMWFTDYSWLWQSLI